MSAPLAALTPCPQPSGRAALCAGGKPVALRGSNYIRVDSTNYHSTFAPGANFTRFDLALDKMQSRGENVVRVFVDGRAGTGIGGADGATEPLDLAYVERLSRFVASAAERRIYTCVTLEILPQNAYFRNLTRAVPSAIDIHKNTAFLTPVGIEAWRTYGSALGSALSRALPPALHPSVVWSAMNEHSLNGGEPPFNETSGVVQTTAGAYDMANATQRQEAADANSLLWAEATRTALRASFGNTLVTVGVFTFQAAQKKGPRGLPMEDCHPKSNQCRFPARPAVLGKSKLDFLDVHIYLPSGDAAELAADLATSEWDDVPEDKPALMGEFGCNTNWQTSAKACVPHVVKLQASSCAFGFKAGWLFWTYDTDIDPPAERAKHFYSMEDDGGAIGNALAPSNRSDPCAPPPIR